MQSVFVSQASLLLCKALSEKGGRKMKNNFQLIILLILTLIQNYSNITKYLTYKKNPQKYTPELIKSIGVVSIVLIILTIIELVLICMNLLE